MGINIREKCCKFVTLVYLARYDIKETSASISDENLLTIISSSL
jgi:hypothetical protein